MKRVLIVAAHPDDDILGAAGSINKKGREGTSFHVLFVGEGSTSRFEDTNSSEALEAIGVRERAARQALAELGVHNMTFLNMPCSRCDTVPMLDINKQIERAVYDYRPDEVWTHARDDVNIDHQIVFRSVLVATRPVSSRHTVQRVLSFEVLSSTEWSYCGGFSPNYFESLSEEDLEAKKLAMKRYDSELKEFPFPRSQEGIETLARYRGMQCGKRAAEAFVLVRHFE